MLSTKKNKFLILLFLFFKTLNAQEYPSNIITTNDGLANNSVYSIYKDSRDIVWVGTDNGLSAIQNGLVKNYFTSDGLAHNSCWAIIEDPNNHLWFGSFGGGITHFDGKKFSIIQTKNGLIHDKIRTLFIHKNHLFVGTQFGFSVIDINTRKIVFSGKIKGKKGLFQIMDFFIKDNKIQFATFDDGVWSINLERKTFQLESLEIPAIFSVYASDDKFFYSHISLKEKINNQISIKDNLNLSSTQINTNTILWDYTKDNKGKIYAAANGINFTNGGVYELSENGLINQNNRFGIPSHQVWSVHFDSKLNLLYVGTIDKGLFKVEIESPLIHYPSYNFKKEQLDILKIAKNNSKQFILGKNEFMFLSKNKLIKELSKKNFYDFLRNYNLNDYQKWQSENFGSYQKIPLNEFELKDFKIESSHIWLSSNLGLFKITKDGIIIDYHRTIVDQFSFLNKNQLLFEEPYGFFWISNDLTKKEGFKKYNDLRRNTVQIIDLFNKKFILSASMGLFAYQDETFFSYAESKLWTENELVHGTVNGENNLIIGNKSGDVFILDVSNKFKLLKKISSEQLLGKSIYFIESYKNNIIIGNEKGIVIYNNGQIRLIDEEQGLKNKNISTSFLNENILSIGTTNGYYELDLEKYISKPYLKPELKLTNLEVNFEPFTKEYYQWLSYDIKKLDLEYNKNTVSLSFEPQNVAYPNKLLYRFNLSGMENAKWSNWTSSKTINLTYLRPGNYTLLMEIKDLHIGKTTSIKFIKININPPIWETWWFIISLIIITLGISFVIIKNRMNKLSKKQRDKSEIEKRIAETKMEALQSQMNPHFIFNSLNSIQYFILDNNIDKALLYLGEFSNLIRQTLNNSSKIKISLEDEISYLRHYIKLECLRLNNTIDVKIKTEKNMDLASTSIPPMLIQPFVENAFVHAFNSESIEPKILISFKSEPDYLICEIKDNGKGMPSKQSAKMYESKGIKLVAERLSLLQVDLNFALSISSEQKHGTRVVLRIKYV
jgi:ligand-binding sensor domain-containing protein